MIEVGHFQTYGWESAVRLLNGDKGVCCRGENQYEAYICYHGKYVYCGTYKRKEDAIESVVNARMELFKGNIIKNGDDPISVVPSSEYGYFASPIGNIYNRFGEPILGGVDRCGYREATINGKQKTIHKIIADTFIPNPNGFKCINHKDGDKLNNRVENLERCTHSYNTTHAYRIELEKAVCGENHPMHKLTESDVKCIRSMYKRKSRDFGATALSHKYGVSCCTILDIVSNRTWRSIL